MNYPNSLRRPLIIINDLPPIPAPDIKRPTQQQLRNMMQVMAIPQPDRKFRSYMRRVPVFGPAVTVGTLVFDWVHWLNSGTSEQNMNGWTKYNECFQSGGPTHYLMLGAGPGEAAFENFNNFADACLSGQALNPSNEWPPVSVPPPNKGVIGVEHTHDFLGQRRFRIAVAYGRTVADTDKWIEEGVDRSPRHLPWLNPRVSPYSTFYPPLMNAPAVAPWLRYGYGGERRTALLPEDSEAGYEAPGQMPTPNPPWLISEPPPGGTKERKMRIKDRALGAIIQRVVGGATEALDYAWALFNSLPMYLRYRAFNMYRRLETRGSGGFVKEARLHYVALTPQEMLEYVYDNLDAMDPQVLLLNILQMQGSDRAWAAIGRAMGRYARGPWDQPQPNGPNASDWQPFIEFVTEQILHNELLLDDVALQYGLTREEMRIINNRFRQYREQNPGYEPPITL